MKQVPRRSRKRVIAEPSKHDFSGAITPRLQMVKRVVKTWRLPGDHVSEKPGFHVLWSNYA